MTAVSIILLGFVVWALVFGLGNPFATSYTSIFGIHAYADTSVTQYGTDGGYGEKGGDMPMVDVAYGSADYLYL